MNDSHQYRFPFLIKLREDFPQDFPRFPEWIRLPALFLPRDDPDWLGRSANPPRVIAIGDEAIEVHFHPESGLPAVSVPFGLELSIQTGRALLIGWIRFASTGTDVKLPFNRRVDRPVRDFLGFLRAHLFRGGAALTHEGLLLGDALNIKFRNALDDELDKGETELVRLFAGLREQRVGRWLARTRSTPADVLVLTDRRILWITERRRGGFRQNYGSAVCYAGFENIAALDLRRSDGAPELHVDLRNGKRWIVNIPEHVVEAAERAVKAMEQALRQSFLWRRSAASDR